MDVGGLWKSSVLFLFFCKRTLILEWKKWDFVLFFGGREMRREIFGLWFRRRLADIYLLWPVMYCSQLHSFKTCLGRGFHSLPRNASFLSPTDVGSHNLPPSGPALSLAHRPVSSCDTIYNKPSFQTQQLETLPRKQFYYFKINEKNMKRIIY